MFIKTFADLFRNYSLYGQALEIPGLLKAINSKVNIHMYLRTEQSM